MKRILGDRGQDWPSELRPCTGYGLSPTGEEVIDHGNLSSVGIRLDRYVKDGSLRMVSARTITGSAETYLMRIKTLARGTLSHTSTVIRTLGLDPVTA